MRGAEPADSTAIARAHIRAWQVGYRDLMPAEFLDGLDESAGAEGWERRLLDAGGEATDRVEFLVAEIRRGPDEPFDLVGVTTIGPDREPETETDGEVWMITVRPDAWSRGAGGALLAAAVERLTELGYRRLVLWVLRDNERARRFYEANGWRADGTSTVVEHGGRRLPEVRYTHRA